MLKNEKKACNLKNTSNTEKGKKRKKKEKKMLASSDIGER